MPKSALRVAAAAAIVLAGIGATPRAPASSPPYHPVSVVPQPRSLRQESGSYRWPRAARIGVGGPAERAAAARLQRYLALNGIGASIVERRRGADVMLDIVAQKQPQLGEEGYELVVRPDGVAMRANTDAGLFYALQTLDQITSRRADALRSATVTITDRPEYRWRGIHLDVARRFFPVPVVERYIAVAARYKLNVFHWHLTDDQAWRLQSAHYPALTGGGAFYSAADVREVLAYAAARHVTVVPEIDMPAHVDAALRAYPSLACGEGVICTNGAGLAFARTVLDEAIAQFPSPYVHAGGDEVPWPASRAQPQFTSVLERKAAAHGRRLAGWDEIVTPQLSRTTLLTVWRGRQRAALIARGGHDVVIASAPLYFDAAQGDPAQEPPATRHMSTLEQVYSDAVLPPGLDAASSRHLAGVQANVWTEHIETEPQLFRMLLPRALALSEIAWTPRTRKDWSGFLARLPAQLAWLDAHGYAFRIPNVAFAISGGPARFDAVAGHVQSVRVTTSAPALTVTLSVPLADATIRYTTDGTPPSATSAPYRGPFTVRAAERPLRIRACAFFHGRRGAETESLIARVSPSALHALLARRGGAASWASLVSP
ncbi:MAG TPA: family 20 glycosylhydrolase [Candidatus Limnocylindrales bacterium]|nr:family 20 glycosylhydrolase [Candidatus Limnocylindrales bacterium]